MSHINETPTVFHATQQKVTILKSSYEALVLLHNSVRVHLLAYMTESSTGSMDRFACAASSCWVPILIVPSASSLLVSASRALFLVL